MKNGIRSLLVVAIFGGALLLSGCGGSDDDVEREGRYYPGGGKTWQPRDEKGRFEKNTPERPVVFGSEKD